MREAARCERGLAVQAIVAIIEDSVSRRVLCAR